MKNPLPAPVVRVASALVVSAVLFQAGREVGRLESQAAGAGAKPDHGNEIVTATFRGEPEPPAEVKPDVSAGKPLGETGDLITPLNVRDPSALVMGIGGYACPSPEQPPSALPPVPKPSFKMDRMKKAEEIPEGRLLDLLKKQDKPRSDVPKVY
ncbi:MAG: hypothetical protein M0D55_11330 [Elusimicrobiota bacterium]|nr:MAG: hypothetical protein M0D55_11330 [Elusimicrobiota bacterium]